ncbi:hypothetical protein TIFTF001_028031 [Ficus carica]|uniref:MULE transposase domain-containing protein n=1 Tax=Ficus carica TaxID=3494 RepID=A0AA88DP83_FICCA|nr:hypothetical protein TIFTF001_028031 [Ficus carica]
MKGILVPFIANYVGLIELVRSVIRIRGLEKTIVMRYAVEPIMLHVKIHCDADVYFNIQLKKKDIHALSKFPISIDVLDESVVEAIPPEVRESNHIPMQSSRDGGQSDEAMKLLIIQTRGVSQEALEPNLRTQSVHVPGSDNFSSAVVVADFTPITMRFGGILLTTCGHDTDGSIFSLAFGIVLSESNELWKWFFEKLRDSIDMQEPLAIVTDRYKGIKYATSFVYPDVDFGICA